MGIEQNKGNVDLLLDQLCLKADKSIGKLVQQRLQLKRLTRKADSLGQETVRLQSELAREQEDKRLLAKRYQGDPGQQQQLQEDNQLLAEKNQMLKEENDRLNDQLSRLQSRLKSITESPLTDSSAAILEMIRESLNDEDAHNEHQQPAMPVPARFSAKEILDQWCQRYPKAFSVPCLQPLKIGIHEDLVKLEAIPDHWVRRALASYVRSPRYLRLLKAGAVRLDLKGNNAGFISEDEAHHAEEQLEEIRQQRLEKERKLREKDEARRMNSKLEQLVTQHS